MNIQSVRKILARQAFEQFLKEPSLQTMMKVMSRISDIIKHEEQK